MMRNAIKKWAGMLLALALLCVCAAVCAENSGKCGDTATWTLDSNGLLTIEGTGTVTSGGWNREDIVEVQVKEGITGISKGLFQEHGNLESVFLPASLKEIGEDPHPFIYSPLLKSITVASGNTVFVSQDGVVFDKSMKTLLICPGGKTGKYTIPSTVTEIRPEAFFDCRNLTGVVIPSGVKEIGKRAFYRCFSLEKAEVPSGVTILNKSVFEQCKSMTSVKLPAGITAIEVWAFWGDESLKEITIPDGVRKLGEEAFSGCSALEKAVIPDSVKTIEKGAFDSPSKVIVHCSDGSPAEMFARNAGLAVYSTGTYTAQEGDEEEDPENPEESSEEKEPEEEKAVKEPEPSGDVVTVGETIQFSGSSTIGGPFLDTAFKADSTRPEVAKVSGIARTGNINYSNATEYFFSVWVDGVSPGTATVTLYDNSKTIVLWKRTVKVNGVPPKLESVAFSVKTAKVNESVGITAVTSTNAETLTMYNNGKAVKAWTEGYTDSDGSRTWEVTYTFKGAGARSLEFDVTDAGGEASGKKTAAINITEDQGPTLSSVKFAKAAATVKQQVTITAVTSTDAAQLNMYAGKTPAKSWSSGYSDKDGKRTWKVTYAFSSAGNDRKLTFKAQNENGKLSAGKDAVITITKAPAISSAEFSRRTATVKQKVTITAVTSTNVIQLNMYSGKTLAQSWKKVYTDKDGKRIWKVTYAFGGAGKDRKLTFRGQDANGALTAGKDAVITITKAPSISGVKFAVATAKVKEKVTIKAVTSTNVTQLNMYSGTKLVKSWTTGYTDKDGKRTWKVTYAFGGAGKDRKLTFKGKDANGALTAGKDAVITITK